MRLGPSSWNVAALLVLLPACGSDGGSSSGDEDASGTADARPSVDGNPSPSDAPAAPPDAAPAAVGDTAGIYDLVSPIDITASAVFPQPVYQYYDLLRQFRNDPAGTLFLVLEEAGVPLVGELLDLIPDSLESRVTGFINDYVADAVFEGGPVSDELELLFQYAETTLGTFDLVSELELEAPATDGTSLARHKLLALRFHVGGEVIDVPVPDSVPPPLSVEEDVAAEVGPSLSGADGALVLGDHGFGVHYGELAWDALQEAARRRWGGGVRESLGLLMDCPALAADVAGRCVLSVCVGHAAQIEAVCEAGLDELVARVQAEFESLTLDAVHLAHGEADLWDPPLGGSDDGVIDRIEAGVWDATVDFGMDPRVVPASFTGVRRTP